MKGEQREYRAARVACMAPTNQNQRSNSGRDRAAIHTQMADIQVLLLYMKMPKGVLFRAHLDATVDKGYLLRLVLKEPYLHVRTPCVATFTNSTTTQLELRPFKEVQLSQYVSDKGVEYRGCLSNPWRT